MLLLLLLFNVLPSSFPQVCDHNQDGYGDDDHKDGRDHGDGNGDDNGDCDDNSGDQAVIEEVNDRDLEKLVEENDFVAVAW